MKGKVSSITVRIGDRVKTFEGRMAWTLDQLLLAGAVGCTPITHPAPRWSDYVFKLRREGLDIETITEKHGGPYAGHHARYVLRSVVTVIDSRVAA